MTAARFTCTALSVMVTFSVSLPVSNATICVCASRLAATQASANSGDSMNWRTLSVTKDSIELARVPDRAVSVVAAVGGRPCAASASTASLVTAWMSSRVKISVVIRSTMAFWTAGSSARGVMVST